MAAELKSAMRRLAKSVVVLTTRHGGRRMVMAATAVDSLSMDPPSLIACIDRSASMFPAFAAGTPFCVGILGREHETVARLCGGMAKGEDRFRAGEWLERAGVPYLADTQANVFCVQDGAFFYGSHGVFVGRVEHVEVRGSVRPLIYFDGRYDGVRSAT